MAWLDEYQTGSFRGVPFKTESHQLVGGRRSSEHEFPARDEAATDDLGRSLRKFSLDLYVLGDDYFTQRDALIEALEKEGPGELIHPYLGRKLVQAGQFTLSETKSEGRIARFNVSFVEAGQIKFPDESQDDIAQSILDADATIENSASFFETVFSTANQTAFVIQAAADNLTSIADQMDAAVKKVTEPVTNITFAIRNLKASASDLVKKPGELAARLKDTFALLVSEFESDPKTSVRVLGVLVGGLDSNVTQVIGSTPSRAQQQTNQDAMGNLAKDLGLANQSKSTVEVDFQSVEAAIQARNDVVEGIDQRIDSVLDDDLFQSMKDLQTSLTRALPRAGTTELISVTPKITLPAIVIAYDLFEDIDKETEIVEQNAIFHPGFVPGGEPIEVSAGG